MIKYMEITALLTVALNFYHCSFYLEKKESMNYSKLIAVLLNLLPVAVAILIRCSVNERLYYSLLGFVGLFYLPFIIYMSSNTKGQSTFIFMLVASITTLSICLNIILVNIIDRNMLSNFYVIEVTRIIINIIFVYICYVTIRKPTKKFINNHDFKMPAVSFIACFNHAISVVFNNSFLELKEISWLSMVFVFFVLVVLAGIIMLKNFASNIIMDYKIHEKEKMNARTLDIHLHYYNDINKIVENLRVERHDVKHTLAIIKTLIYEGKNDEVLDVINGYNKNLEEIRFERYCLNDIINANLSYYFSLADKLNITYNYNINVPEKIFIKASDLTSIIGNILENAINASQGVDEGKYIDITIKVHKENLVIKCSNRYNGDNGEHGEGLGLYSIEGISHKYNGYTNITKINSIFNITVVLLMG